MSLIYLEDNFITREQSRYIINYYKTHLDSVKQYDFNYPLSILNTTDYSLKTISDRILSICKRFKNDVDLDNLEIVKWPVKSHMKFHKDTGDVFASILYLNDNYIGGNTAFDSFQVDPKVGRLLIFSNSYYRHCVKEVGGTSRYTLAAWYVADWRLRYVAKTLEGMNSYQKELLEKDFF